MSESFSWRLEPVSDGYNMNDTATGVYAVLAAQSRLRSSAGGMLRHLCDMSRKQVKLNILLTDIVISLNSDMLGDLKAYTPEHINLSHAMYNRCLRA